MLPDQLSVVHCFLYQNCTRMGRLYERKCCMQFEIQVIQQRIRMFKVMQSIIASIPYLQYSCPARSTTRHNFQVAQWLVEYLPLMWHHLLICSCRIIILLQLQEGCLHAVWRTQQGSSRIGRFYHIDVYNIALIIKEECNEIFL